MRKVPATDFTDHKGHQTVEQGTDAIVRMATIGASGPTGTLSTAFGDGWIPPARITTSEPPHHFAYRTDTARAGSEPW